MNTFSTYQTRADDHPHELVAIAGQPLDQAKKALVMLHGRGDRASSSGM